FLPSPSLPLPHLNGEWEVAPHHAALPRDLSFTVAPPRWNSPHPHSGRRPGDPQEALMKHTKVLAALTSLGVTASMMAFGGAAAATTQDYTPSLPNPQLEAQCGLDFGLVLDSSGSIGNTGIQNLKNATDAFVDALVDTGSTVAVTSFSTSSPGSGGANLTPTALTSANLAGIKASYSGLNSDGWT